eukprot:1150539-Pelagomonas_calceolata.AAC.7
MLEAKADPAVGHAMYTHLCMQHSALHSLRCMHAVTVAEGEQCQPLHTPLLGLNRAGHAPEKRNPQSTGFSMEVLLLIASAQC